MLAPLRAREPDRPVHPIAHSLGAQVALSALTRLRPGDVQLVILLAAALSLQAARTACAAPAGGEAEVINVVGRENQLFDLLPRLALSHYGKRLGSRGIDAQNWLDLPLDDAALLERLGRMGWPIAPARARPWSGYLGPVVWALYRAPPSRPDETPLAWLRDPGRLESAGRRGPCWQESLSEGPSAARRCRSERVGPSARDQAIRLEHPTRKDRAERRAHRLSSRERRGVKGLERRLEAGLGHGN